MRGAQLGVGQIRALEVGLAKGGDVHFASNESRLLECGTFRADERHARASQIGLREVCSVELGGGKNRLLQVGAGELAALQVEVVELCTGEVLLAEVVIVQSPELLPL